MVGYMIVKRVFNYAAVCDPDAVGSNRKILDLSDHS